MSTAPKTPPFDPASRYYGVETAEIALADGRTLTYVKRRFIAQPSHFETLTYHTVIEGDRIDNVAAQQLGDPLQYWRICDANAAMAPDDLTETPGRRIRITLPEGIPGVRNE